ncbi:hypothetical protein EDB89DRAFT_1985050 [Lactarius sanguifluus]|nr:hypothetical protein EDB89DRAFT_1985050 [Lactarius sanguifluus]
MVRYCTWRFPPFISTWLAFSLRTCMIPQDPRFSAPLSISGPSDCHLSFITSKYKMVRSPNTKTGALNGECLPPLESLVLKPESG